MHKKYVSVIASMLVLLAFSSISQSVDLRPFAGSTINYYGNAANLTNYPFNAGQGQWGIGGQAFTSSTGTPMGRYARYYAATWWTNFPPPTYMATWNSTLGQIEIKSRGMYIFNVESEVYTASTNELVCLWIVNETPGSATLALHSTSVVPLPGQTAKLAMSTVMYCNTNSVVYPAFSANNAGSAGLPLYIGGGTQAISMVRVDPLFWNATGGRANYDGTITDEPVISETSTNDWKP